jgi:para-aminobenzoate synthetase component 1
MPLPTILEGGREFGEAGRFSHLMAEPTLVFEAIGMRWQVTSCRADFTSQNLDLGLDDPLACLGSLMDRLGLSTALPRGDAGGEFRGGLVGYFGYDLAPRIETLPRRRPRDSRLPDIRLAFYDSGLTIDHQSGAVTAWSTGLQGKTESAVRDRLDQFVRAIETTDPREITPSSLGPVAASTTKEDYLSAVRRALGYIAAGDIFQVNLSQRFESKGRVDPFDLYQRLRRRSPSPFSAYLQWDDLALVSASPEWFYRTEDDGRIVTRPIKGTRPRGADEAEDRRLIAELLDSPKDRAELTMIVDLERNDLGRVCRYGSVTVEDALSVESYAQVHHLVATVAGRLRADAGPIDIVRALFPGGSITGAPKIRAMEIIDELEPNRRSAYTGAIGYLGLGGVSCFNIAIRTMIVEGDRVSYQVGGGIVADSIPESEYQETLDKGRGLRAVIEGAES